jgi:phage gpG-like protein
VCCENKLDGWETDWRRINGGKESVTHNKKIKRTFKNEVKKKEKKNMNVKKKPKERKIKFTVQGRTMKEL